MLNAYIKEKFQDISRDVNAALIVCFSDLEPFVISQGRNKKLHHHLFDNIDYEDLNHNHIHPLHTLSNHLPLRNNENLDLYSFPVISQLYEIEDHKSLVLFIGDSSSPFNESQLQLIAVHSKLIQLMLENNQLRIQSSKLKSQLELPHTHAASNAKHASDEDQLYNPEKSKRKPKREELVELLDYFGDSTDAKKELADYLNISLATLYRWFKKHEIH